jgi:16S rRNA G966 N2-methylase RsmD
MTALDSAGWIKPHAIIVAETAKKETLVVPSGFQILFTRAYGEPALHFIKRS